MNDPNPDAIYYSRNVTHDVTLLSHTLQHHTALPTIARRYARHVRHTATEPCDALSGLGPTRRTAGSWWGTAAPGRSGAGQGGARGGETTTGEERRGEEMKRGAEEGRSSSGVGRLRVIGDAPVALPLPRLGHHPPSPPPSRRSSAAGVASRWSVGRAAAAAAVVY